jgi:Tol biopolymer transport system component
MSTRAARLNALWTAAFLAGCLGDSTGIGDRRSPAGMIVSDPTQPAAAMQRSGALSAVVIGDGSAYVSLRPGTVPGGNIATIRNRRTGGTEMALIIAGGFDPVTIAASPGDSLDVDVELFEPGAPVHIVIPVPLTRPPVVVRTDPPPKKRDVPLNAAVVVVFSEPIDSTTLTTASIQLLDGSTRVPTHLDLRDSMHVRAVLVPDALLAPNVTYTLVVTSAVRDLSGDPLAEPISVGFTTAAGPSGRSQIAFTQYGGASYEGAYQGIYAINPDGTGATFLVDDYGNFGTDEPAWSPDGRRLAFISGRHKAYGLAGENAVYVMNADGSGLTRLTNSLAGESWPAWSPNGTRIAFARWTCMNPQCTQQGYSAVYTMNADGSGVTRLTDPVGIGEDAKPSWSPDGARIVFVRGTDSTLSDLYVMNADGSNVIRLTNGQFAVGTPAWSPDGLRIAYARASIYIGDFDIYVMNTDGSNVRQLTSGPAVDLFPSWSPDGERIAFSSEGRSSGNAQIYLMNADGSGLTRVTDDPFGATEPDWSRASSP